MKTLGTIQADANAEVYAVATGALPDGKPVIVNSNGTVSVAAGSTVTQALGTPVVFESGGAAINNVVFDSNSNRIVIAYMDMDNSYYGTAVVGTVNSSDNSISFGTPVVFRSASINIHRGLAFDSSSYKVVIAYAGPSNGKAIVGTVDSSDNSISFGSEVSFESSVPTSVAAGYDASNNKILISFKDQNNSNYGTAIVGTVSGTGISFGSQVVFESGNAVDMSNTYDPNSEKMIITYNKSAGGNEASAIVGTISGTSVSFGTRVAIQSGKFYENLVATYDTNSNVLVVAYKQDTDQYSATRVGTVSGTSISFGSEVQFSSGRTTTTAIAFDSNLNKIVIAFEDPNASSKGTVVSGSISGTTISLDTPVVFEAGGTNSNAMGMAFDSTAKRIVIAYQDIPDSEKGKAVVFKTGGLSTNLTTENFLGFTGGIKNTVTETQAVGSEVTFHAVAAYPSRATFDSSNNKIVIAYEDNDDSSHGKAVVGTIDPSDNSVSYGSPVDFESAATNHAFITFDSNSNKVVIAYQDADNSTYGTAIVGTVSGTSISFGSPVVFAAVANTGVGGITFDSASNKVVIIYEDTGNSERGTAIVGTVSGTSISFGSEATFTSSKISPAYATVSFDSTSNRVVVGYRDYTNSGHGYAAVGTVSGTSISFGTPVAFNAASTLHVSSAYDSNADKTLITYRDDGNSSYGTAIVGTVSGTSISFGSGTVFNSANSGYQSASFNSSTKNITVSYTDVGNSNVGKVVTATISGSSVSFGSTITFANETVITYGNAYDSANNRTILTYRDTGGDDHGQSIVFKSGGDVVTFGSTPDGKTATVQAGGAINTLQSSLTAGQQYFVQADGTIGTTAASPSVIAGTAVSATDLIVKG